MDRLDDIAIDSTSVVGEIVEALRGAPTDAQVLAASLRHPEHAVAAARLGCELRGLVDAPAGVR